MTGIHTESKKAVQMGLSMVEIMLALALSAFVLTGILKILASTKDTHRLEMGVAQVQDSGRFAINRLTERIRYRGYFGCIEPTIMDVTDMTPIDWDSGDELPIRPKAKNAPSSNLNAAALRGFTVESATQLKPNISSSGSFDYDIADIQAVVDSEFDLKVDSDIISIQHASMESVDLAKKPNSESDALVIENNSLGLAQGDLVFIGDCLAADVFAVSNVPVGTTNVSLEHDTSFNNSTKLGKVYYPEDSKVRRLVAETFFVADTGRTSTDGTPIYSLYRASPDQTATAADLRYEELVEGVEYLKILYGQRTANNRIRYIEAPAAGSATSDFWLRVESIQIALLIRSLTPTLSEDNTSTYRLLDEDVGTTTALSHDGGPYYRQVFTTTVQLRNRG